MAWKAKAELLHQFHIEHPFISLMFNFLFGIASLGGLIAIIIVCWDMIDMWILIPTGLLGLFIYSSVVKIVDCINIINNN